MYHNKAHRKLGRTHTHRIATLRALSTALFQRERIRTTLMKAKELRPFAEKLITKSKRDTLHARRMVGRHIHDRLVARKLFTELSPRYGDRSGGYMRILKLGRRQGDGAEMALVELIGSEPVFEKEKPGKGGKKGLASRLMGGRAKQESPPETEKAEADSAEKTEGAPAETKTPRTSKTTRTKKAAAAKKPAKAASPRKPKARPAAKKSSGPVKGDKKK